MKITLELYDTRYTVETNTNDYPADELKEIFSKMLVQAGFSPSVIDVEDGGSYEYVAEDETVVKVEKLPGFGASCEDYAKAQLAEKAE